MKAKPFSSNPATTLFLKNKTEINKLSLRLKRRGLFYDMILNEIFFNKIIKEII